MNRLVIDTCVFVEGFFNSEESSSSYLLSNIDNINARLVFSQPMIGELLYILKRECNKLEMEPEATHAILIEAVTLFQHGKSINTRGLSNVPQVNDPEDQMFVDAAAASKATHIITLDNKSGILGLTNVPFSCVTPDDFLHSIKLNDAVNN